MAWVNFMVGRIVGVLFDQDKPCCLLVGKKPLRTGTGSRRLLSRPHHLSAHVHRAVGAVSTVEKCECVSINANAPICRYVNANSLVSAA